MYSDSLSFYLISFSVSGCHTAYSCHVSLGFSRPWQFLRLVWWPWQIWGVPIMYLTKYVSWDVSCFSHDQTGVLGWKTTAVSAILITPYQGDAPPVWYNTVAVDLIAWMRECLSGMSTIEFCPLLSSILCSWKEVAMCSLHLWGGGLWSTSWREEC